MKITSKISQNSIKIYVNNILHIYFLRDQFICLQSWQYETETMFYIELTLINGTITFDYDRRDMWIEILLELNKLR